MRKVEIEFVSEQQYHDDRESSKLKAKGTMEEIDGIKVISYTEPDDEMGKCETIVKVINNHFIEMRRSGVYETRFTLPDEKAGKERAS